LFVVVSLEIEFTLISLNIFISPVNQFSGNKVSKLTFTALSHSFCISFIDKLISAALA